MSCNDRRRTPLYLSVFIFLMMILVACGKKAPPVPPQHIIPPAVNDLSYQLSGNILHLSWTPPEAKHTDTGAVAGCIVFRGRSAVSGSECPACPSKFQPMADLPVGTAGQSKPYVKTMTYSEPLVQGYRYTYKVNCYPAKGEGGRDSNTVTFDY